MAMPDAMHFELDFVADLFSQKRLRNRRKIADQSLVRIGIPRAENRKMFRGIRLEVNRLHQLVMTETLQTTRDPDTFAFGDCAA